jgi:hypothetical protein
LSTVRRVWRYQRAETGELKLSTVRRVWRYQRAETGELKLSTVRRVWRYQRAETGDLKLSKVRRVWRYQRVIRIRKSKKDRQHNGQKKKYKKWSTKHTHKIKDWVTRTPSKAGVTWGTPER